MRLINLLGGGKKIPFDVFTLGGGSHIDGTKLMKNLIQKSGDVKLFADCKKISVEESKRKKGVDILGFGYKRTNLPDREEKAIRLFRCGKKLIYAENPTGGDPILVSAMRCGLRLCPSCSWIRARRIFENVHAVITHRDFADKQFIFLTLTVKNCEGEKLDGEIKRILAAWGKLTANERQPFRKSFAGTFRALEVTYNSIKKNYHPHLHAIAAVDSGYFRKSNPDYISQPVLRFLWRKACGLDYLPQCRIQRVKNTAKKQVAEVAKYTVKSADYLNRPAVLEVLDPALRSKRLIAYGGLFKTVRDRLILPDEDELGENEFPQVAVDELLQNPYIRKIMLEWTLGFYRLSVLQPSDDPADWLEPGRLAAEALRRSALGGQGG